MENEKCRFYYPRGFSSTTMAGKDGYPIYQRRDNGRKIIKKNKELDNRWVVPYSSYLLTRYGCHINVEICSSIKSVKYLYKYVYKGHDKISVYIASNDGNNLVDEIEQFQDARFVSPQEAAWRIYEFNLNEMNPPVINLQLHLPNKQAVYYWENQNLQEVVLWEHVSKTMLTEFFTTCSEDPIARQYLYR